MTRRAFALLTDFGLDTPYVGQLKATLFSHAPSVPVLDITHAVPPCSIMAGALFLFSSRPHFPAGTIFICVIDPEVGSSRKILCLAGRNHIVLGPDNGLLSLAHHDMLTEGEVKTYCLDEQALQGSPTFQGRDVIAPAAAKLANGMSPKTLGPAFRAVHTAPLWAQPEMTPLYYTCTVLHVDRFGNCILNVPLTATFPNCPVAVTVPHTGHSHGVISATHYQQLPKSVPGIIPGSQRFYELACNKASAAEHLCLKPGDICRIEFS